jgi:hypothetical protein
MLNEHAITYKERLSIADLDYIIKKANRLGRNGKEVVRVYQQEDDEGFHVYLETQSIIKERDNE